MHAGSVLVMGTVLALVLLTAVPSSTEAAAAATMFDTPLSPAPAGRRNDECCRRVSFFHRNIEYDNDGKGFPVHYNTSADFAGASSSFHVDFQHSPGATSKMYVYNSRLGKIWGVSWDGKCYEKPFPPQPKCIPADGRIIGQRRLAWSYLVDVWQFRLKSPHPDARMLYNAVTQDGVCNPVFSDAFTPTQQLSQLFSYDSVLKTFDPAIFDKPKECWSNALPMASHPLLEAELDARIARMFPA